MVKRISIFVLAGFFITAFVWWRVYAVQNQAPPAYTAIVRDVSASDTAGCSSVGAAAIRAGQRPGVTRGSKVALITTGDQENGYEGRLAGTFDVPFSTRVMEGRKAVERQQVRLGASIQHACEAAPKAEQSPIFAAVKTGIEHLRANGCGKVSLCSLIVITDGEENVDRTLRAALNGSKSSLEKLRGTVDNAGIAVRFCGLAQTRMARTTQHTARSSKRISDVWIALFSTPGLVETEPYCTD